MSLFFLLLLYKSFMAIQATTSLPLSSTGLSLTNQRQNRCENRREILFHIIGDVHCCCSKLERYGVGEKN